MERARASGFEGQAGVYVLAARWLTGVCGAAVGLAGVVALFARLSGAVGIPWNVRFLAVPWPRAAAFLLLGLCLVLRAWQHPKRHRKAASAALAVVLVGTFMEARGIPGADPDTVASLALILLSASLLLPSSWWRVSETAASMVACFSAFAFAADAFGSVVHPMATDLSWQTSALLLCGAIGAFAVEPEKGLARLFFSKNLGGTLARRVAPVAFLLPFIVVAGYEALHRANILEDQRLVALTATVLAYSILAVVAVVSLRVERLDAERARQAHQLQEAMDRTAAAEEATARGTWSLVPSTMSVTWSPGMYRVFGVHPDFEATPQNIAALLHPDDRAAFLGPFLAGFQQPGTYSGDYRLLARDAAARWLRFEAASGLDPATGAFSVRGSVQDITERKELEAARQQALDHAKDAQLQAGVAAFRTRFINLAAHELRTPLTPIQLNLATLRRQSSTMPGGIPTALASLQRNVDRLAALTQDLVDAADMQTADLVLRKADCHLAETVGTVLMALAQKAVAKGIELELKQPAWPGTVLADEHQLQKVLYHFVDNGIKFTPPGGRVVVSVSGQGGAAQVAVADTGAGLTKEQIGHLFQPFVQVHDTMQTSDQGVGLGLYIAKTIVEGHGGQVMVDSAGPGLGSTFTLSLPLQTDAETPAPKQAA